MARPSEARDALWLCQDPTRASTADEPSGGGCEGKDREKPRERTSPPRFTPTWCGQRRPRSSVRAARVPKDRVRAGGRGGSPWEAFGVRLGPMEELIEESLGANGTWRMVRSSVERPRSPTCPRSPIDSRAAVSAKLSPSGPSSLRGASNQPRESRFPC